MNRKTLGIILTLTMVLSMLPAAVMTATALDNVPYVDQDGTPRTASGVTEVTSSTTTWSNGWYVVPAGDPVTISARITVTGDVHLILADSGSLTAGQGIYVANGNSITIYGQEGQRGKLTANGPACSAAIGGNGWEEYSGSITIHGGIIVASAPPSTGDPAGIGGGGYGNAGTILITGGNVTATGSGKGIGGGCDRSGGTITITGGVVTAGGIGSGNYGESVPDIRITGGVVICTSKGINTTNEASWSGCVIYKDGKNGEVYGNVEITEDAELPGGILSIPSGVSLTVSNGATLTSNGTITGGGTIDITDGILADNGTMGDVDIKPAGLSANIVTPPTAKNRDYDGTAQPLVEGGTTTGGTLQYSVNGGGYSATVPSGTNVGAYTVSYKAVGKCLLFRGLSSGMVNVTVEKAMPDYTEPTGLTAVYGDTLASVSLLSGWSWDRPLTTSVGNAGERVFSATFTPGDSQNYKTVQKDLTITVDKARQTISEGMSITVTKSSDFITVNNPTGSTYEYYAGTSAPNDNTVWQQSSSFTGLDPDTAYTVYVRLLGDENHYPSNHLAKTITTADENGAATVKPGETLGKVTNDGRYVRMDFADIYLPEGKNDVEADGDGNVTVPAGSTVWPRNGGFYMPVTVGEKGAIVDKDGNITIPGGGSVTIEGTTVTVPQEDSTIKAGRDGMEIPAGSTVTPRNGPEITVGPGNGATMRWGEDVTLPGGGSAQIGGTTVTVPEIGGTLWPSYRGDVEVPPGSTITFPNGPDITVNDYVTVDEDGNVTLPRGGGVQIDDDITVTIPQGGTLKPDRKGGVTLPENSSVEIGEITVDVPNGGTITPNEDGSVDLPAGSTFVDKNGDEHTVPSQGGKLDAEGNYTDKAVPSTPSAPSTPSTPSTPNTPSGSSGGSGGGWFGGSNSGGSGSSGKPSATPEGGGHTSESGTDSPASSFSDLNPDAWYHEAVDYVIRNGLMTGYGGGKFGPDNILSRAMLAQILYHAAGGIPVNYLMQYDDVLIDAWYTEAIRWAVSEGIVGGYGGSKFGPDDPITREQLAVMLYRYAQSQDNLAGEWTRQLDYPDASEISEYALDAVTWCAINGILSGYEDGALLPKGSATRAEAAAMLMRYFERDK